MYVFNDSMGSYTVVEGKLTYTDMNCKDSTWHCKYRQTDVKYTRAASFSTLEFKLYKHFSGKELLQTQK